MGTVTFRTSCYPPAPNSVDWIITNPPFWLAEPFILRALSLARVGVAILARTVFLESVGRYDALFRDNPQRKSLNLPDEYRW
jgi:hypothetical protein